MPNDFTRNPLAIGPTVSPQSNYLAKPEERIFVENDKRLALARSLQAYNPRLKDWADNYEQKLIEEGRAEAMRIFEAEGKDGILKEKAAAAERENPILICANPYTKRFLDRYKAEQLSVQKYAFMTLELEKQGAYNESDPEKMMSVINDLSRQYDDKHADELSKMDTRELDAVYHDASRKLPDMLMSEYRKYQAERLKEERFSIVTKKIADNINFTEDNFQSETDYLPDEWEEAREADSEPFTFKGISYPVYTDSNGEKYFIESEQLINGGTVQRRAYIDEGTGTVKDLREYAGEGNEFINFTKARESKFMAALNETYKKSLEAGMSIPDFKQALIAAFGAAVKTNPEREIIYTKMLSVALNDLKWEKGYIFGDEQDKDKNPLANLLEIKEIRSELSSIALDSKKKKWEAEALQEEEAGERILNYITQHYFDKDEMSPQSIIKELELKGTANEYKKISDGLKLLQEGKRGTISYDQEVRYNQLREEILFYGGRYKTANLFAMAQLRSIHISHVKELVDLQAQARTGESQRLQGYLSGLYNIIDSNESLSFMQKTNLKNSLRSKAWRDTLKGQGPTDMYEAEEMYRDIVNGMMDERSSYIVSGPNNKSVDVEAFNSREQNINRVINDLYLSKTIKDKKGETVSVNINSIEELAEAYNKFIGYIDNPEEFINNIYATQGVKLSVEDADRYVLFTFRAIKNRLDKARNQEAIEQLTKQERNLRRKRMGTHILWTSKSEEAKKNEEELKKIQDELQERKNRYNQ